MSLRASATVSSRESRGASISRASCTGAQMRMPAFIRYTQASLSISAPLACIGKFARLLGLFSIPSFGAQAVIPPRSSRIRQREYDRNWYRNRNLIERFFNRIKQFRRVATRYEKLDRNFMAMIDIACICIWLL